MDVVRGEVTIVGDQVGQRSRLCFCFYSDQVRAVRADTEWNFTNLFFNAFGKVDGAVRVRGIRRNNERLNES